MNSKEAMALDQHKLLVFVNDLRCTQCDHCVNGQWTEYDGKMFCQECWDINRAEEERERLKEIASLKKRLAELEGIETTATAQ